MRNNSFDCIPLDSPFHLNNEAAYQAWRKHKLAQPAMPDTVRIQSAENLLTEEVNAIVGRCQTHNFVHFAYMQPPASPESALHHLGQKLHLEGLDANLCAEQNGLTRITVRQTATDQTYIPYTSRPLGWHTDGYYNAADQQIHAWLLYCQQPAQQGGENGLMDHHIAYIRLRDQNSDWIRALMHPKAFTIPANTEGGQQIRPAHSGPVFSVSADGKRLHMRYSARQHHVVWRNDPATQEAAAFILALLDSDERHQVHLKLHRGEGIISNNILHNRSRFVDVTEPARRRLLYRARYYGFIGLSTCPGSGTAFGVR